MFCFFMLLLPHLLDISGWVFLSYDDMFCGFYTLHPCSLLFMKCVPFNFIGYYFVSTFVLGSLVLGILSSVTNKLRGA